MFYILLIISLSFELLAARTSDFRILQPFSDILKTKQLKKITANNNI